jgi:hypothetical protein
VAAATHRCFSLIAPESASTATDRFAAYNEESDMAIAVQDGIGYPSPTGAAIAAAVSGEPGLVDPPVTRAAVIFADETTVDLRVEVQADEFGQGLGLVWSVGPRPVYSYGVVD